METKDIITLIGIIVSLIIGLTSIYIGIKNSKKTIFINSVTSLRTKWIETIRNTIVEYCSLANQIPFYSQRAEKEARLEELNFLIKLQLNRNDPFDSQIIEIVDSILKIIKLTCDVEEIKLETKKLINITQDLLKLEWEGVKEESRKGNLSKRNKQKLYNRYLSHYNNGEKSV